jgi:hypothetical protein
MGAEQAQRLSTEYVLADTESRDSAAAAAKEFPQQRSRLLKGWGSEVAEVTNQLAPAPPKSLDGLVPSELLQELDGAAARRRLPYAEPEAKKSQGLRFGTTTACKRTSAISRACSAACVPRRASCCF